MKRGELLRRLVSTFLYLSVLRSLLVLNVVNYEASVAVTLWEMTAVVVLCEVALWFAMRERGRGRQGRAAWPALLILVVVPFVRLPSLPPQRVELGQHEEYDAFLQRAARAIARSNA